MAIRYFATNRALTNLGRAVSARNKRLQLQRGGYYFVDMDRYMAYYLGEVETETMPVEAIVGNDRDATAGSSSDVIFGADFLCHPKIGRIVVCVHGFNVELFEAFTWFRILTDSMRHVSGIGERIATCPADVSPEAADGSMTAFIGFSWPSDGNVLSYLSDQAEARATAPVFGNLLVRLKALGKPVSLVCHSMGNYMACHTLKGLVNEEFVPVKVSRNVKPLLQRGTKERGTEQVRRRDWLIDVFVMLAPDVERRHVTKATGRGVESTYVGPFYSGLQHLVRRNVNVYSRYDSVLRVSDVEKSAREAGIGILSKVTLGLLDFQARNPDYRWEKRLGEAPHPVTAPPNFVSVNAIEVAGRPIDHSDHIDDTEIAQKITSALEII